MLEDAIANLNLSHWDAAVIEVKGRRYLLVAPPLFWSYKPGEEIQKQFAAIVGDNSKEEKYKAALRSIAAGCDGMCPFKASDALNDRT